MPDYSTLEAELESEVRWYSRRMPGTFCRAKGAVLWDEDGNSYIDFLSGCGALNYGHNPEPLKDALLTYAAHDGIVQSMDLHTRARREFMTVFEKVILKPRGLRYRMMFCGPTGTDAVEAALKLSRKFTGRANIAAFTNGFHGMTLGSLAATGASSKRRGSRVAPANIDRMPYDGYYGPDISTIDVISRLLDDPASGFDPPAAFLVETVQGEGGLATAAGIWLEELATLARRHGSLLIVDDIQTGCGRTGHFFSFEKFKLNPDLVCVSKSLSGYGLPLSMLLITPELDVWAPGEHTGTFRGHNYAFVTGRAALEYWQDPAFLRAVEANIDTLDSWIRETIERFQFAKLMSRGRGLMRGIACPPAGVASDICTEAYRRGVALETSGSWDEVLKFLPPLNIEPHLLSQALEQLTASIQTVLAIKRDNPDSGET